MARPVTVTPRMQLRQKRKAIRQKGRLARMLPSPSTTNRRPKCLMVVYEYGISNNE